jgi:hypothetical protein
MTEVVEIFNIVKYIENNLGAKDSFCVRLLNSINEGDYKKFWEIIRYTNNCILDLEPVSKNSKISTGRFASNSFRNFYYFKKNFVKFGLHNRDSSSSFYNKNMLNGFSKVSGVYFINGSNLNVNNLRYI